MISPRIANGIVVTVTVVWVISFVMSIVNPTWAADPQINVIFMAVVGAVVALRRRDGEQRP